MRKIYSNILYGNSAILLIFEYLKRIKHLIILSNIYNTVF
jgi:hypothetical protein